MKIQIHSTLKYEDTGDGRCVRIARPFFVSVDDRLICVESRFVSDLASVPRLFRGVFPRFGPWNAAAVVHDWLYREGKIGDEAITRVEADKIFLAMMRDNPEVGWRAWPMYAGVRLGGWIAWRRYRNNG